MLFAALLAPYVIDWTAYRDTFERGASDYIGRPVTIAGKASVRLLPTPVLSFTNISIGDEAAPDVEMERFRAEVELAPLLKGEVNVIQMSVERPRFHVDLARLADPQGAGLPGGWRINAERISLARLEITDGSAAILDSRTGRRWQAEDIDAVIEAGSLRGPAQIEGDLMLDGTPMLFSAGLGRINSDDTLPARLFIASPGYPVTLTADGALSLAAGMPPRYKGAATVEGVQPESDDAPRSPWADFRAVGGFDLTPDAAIFDHAQVAYGAMERPLVLQASGRFEIGREPRFDLSVSARQIDVDRALGGGAEAPVAIEDGFTALIRRLPALPFPSIPGALRLDAQGVVIGGSVIQAVSVDLATVADAWRIDTLSALLPGETRVDLTGNLSAAAPVTFRGRGRLASQRPTALAAWWRGQVGSAGALDSFAVEADLDFAPDVQQLSNLVATTGGGSVRGSVDLRRVSGQLFATVDLNADRADLAESRALTELLLGRAIRAGQIDQMTVSLRADALSASGIEARSVLVDGGLENGRLDLRNFSVADLAGASIDARGSVEDLFGTPSGRIDASVSAVDISGAAEFLGSVLPENRAVAHLRRVAPVFSPVKAEISAEAGISGAPLTVDLTGSFAETHVELTATGQGSVNDLKGLTGALTLHVDGEDSARVLAQLGLAPLPVQAGPLRFDMKLEGSPAAAGKLTVDASVAGIDLTYAADTVLREGAVYLAGDVTAESADIDPALLLAGLAVPGLGEGHPASARGRLEFGGGELSLALTQAAFDGEPVAGSIQARFGEAARLAGSLDLKSVSLPLLAAFGAGSVPAAQGSGWSDAAFAAAVPPDLALDVKINAEALDLGLPSPASNATLQFGLAGGTLNLDLAAADFAGGKLLGSAVANIKDGEAELVLRAALQGGQLQALVWERSGLPVASGRVDASFDLQGRGRSMAGLVATLAGTGSFAISEGRINALNPAALTAVMGGAEGGDEPDEAQARETFAINFGSGALPFGRAAGSVSVEGGVATIPTVSVSAGDTTVLADARIDLNTLSLNSEWTIRASEQAVPEGTQPSVRLAFSGPIARPGRQVDLNPLLDALRSRYLQRQLDEIEKLEEARRQADARRQAAEETERRAAEEARQAAPPGPAPSQAPAAARPDAAAPSERPAPPAQPGPPLDLLQQQGASNPLADERLPAPL